MRDAVKAHKKAKSLLMEGHRECSAYWSEQFGDDWLAMKIRMDVFQPQRRIFVDMKTTRSLSKAFPKRHSQIWIWQADGLLPERPQRDHRRMVCPDHCGD